MPDQNEELYTSVTNDNIGQVRFWTVFYNVYKDYGPLLCWRGRKSRSADNCSYFFLFTVADKAWAKQCPNRGHFGSSEE